MQSRDMQFSSCREIDDAVRMQYPLINDPLDPAWTKAQENAWAKRLVTQVASPLKERILYVYTPWHEYKRFLYTTNASALQYAERNQICLRN